MLIQCDYPCEHWFVAREVFGIHLSNIDSYYKLNSFPQELVNVHIDKITISIQPP